MGLHNLTENCSLLSEWWGVGPSIRVLCLADNYDEASVNLPKDSRASWVKTRSEPTFMFSKEPPFILARMLMTGFINKKLLLNFPQGMR